jgi:lysyl-tRNA synthetase, class I
MYWVDKIVSEIEERYQEKIARGETLIIRDEKTLSGRVHVGSLRGVMIHGAVAEALMEKGIKVKFLFELNDFDPMDGLPAYLDEKVFGQHMGKPLREVPSPESGSINFAEYFGNDFALAVEKTEVPIEYYRSSDVYKSGRYNEVIRLALENAAAIRSIYKKVSGGEKNEDWLPLQVICDQCGKIGTTKVTSFDGELVTYTCLPHLVKWAEGCGHEGKKSPFDGNAKLPWKVEWAAKFRVMNVDIEGGGKDHSTKGGSRDIANHIAREVFAYEPPYDIPYEFFLVGGKKMSSSKGAGSSAKEIADLLPTPLLRALFLFKEPKKVIDFIPDGDTIPVLYDLYDKYAEGYFVGAKDDYSRAFVFAYPLGQRKNIPKRFLPRFSTVAFLAQMPHMNFPEEIAKLKEEGLTPQDSEEAEERKAYALHWLDLYAVEDFRFVLQEETVPKACDQFTSTQKEALSRLAAYITSKETLDGQELHTALHTIKEETGINPRDFFGALYQSILGKNSGPKAGFLLGVLDKKWLEKRLQKVSR